MAWPLLASGVSFQLCNVWCRSIRRSMRDIMGNVTQWGGMDFDSGEW
jgi:hypothetical protein